MSKWVLVILAVSLTVTAPGDVSQISNDTMQIIISIFSTGALVCATIQGSKEEQG